MMRTLEQSVGGGGPPGPVASARTGVSAGAPDTKFSLWSDASASYLSNDTAMAGLSGYNFTALTGLDYVIDKAWIVGFSAGYERADVSVKAIHGPRLTEGAVFGPYASYIIDQNFSLDALFNYTRVTTGFTRTAAPAASGSYGANRYSGAVNLNGFTSVDDVALNGFVGYVYSVEGTENFADSLAAGYNLATTRYGAVRIGGEAAYSIGDFQPYVPLTLEYQTTRTQDGTNRFAVVLGAGLRYQLSDTLKAGFALTTEEAHSHETNVTGLFNLRWNF
ncbi:MAG: autotransporter outer membrane beta-barrel domain-containing protein [Alphaproteobacteria bacterium]